MIFTTEERAEIKMWMYEYLKRSAVSETLYQKLVHPEKFGVMEDGTTVHT